MNNEQENLIREEFESLPTHLKQAISSIPWKERLKDIASAINLKNELIERFELETMFVLFGLENPKDYVANLQRELELSEESAYMAAGLVGDKIFDPIFDESERLKNTNSVSDRSDLVPEIAPEIHPMTELDTKMSDPVMKKQIKTEPNQDSGANKSDVSSKEPEADKLKPEVPDYRYPGGIDPYREPIN